MGNEVWRRDIAWSCWCPKNVIGYCERHHGYITKNEAKQHRCEAKECYHLRRMTREEVEAVSHNIRLDDMEPVD